MAGELVLIERQLQAYRPRLESALAGIMPATRLEQTILVSCERTPEVGECTPQSIINAAMTFAVLGLPVDGATGQGFLLPFRDNEKRVRVAQAVIGYKGYNTLGARAGLTITAGTVREGDEFEYRRGSGAFVSHRPRLNSDARIVAFWACAEACDRPPSIEVLALEEVLAIRSKSRAAGRGTGPWHDERVGFPAMGEKSARRRLARSLPLVFNAPQYHLAARMEEAVDEQSKLSWITPERGVVVEGEPASLPARDTYTPEATDLLGGRNESIESYLKAEANKGTAALQTAWEQNLNNAERRAWKRMLEVSFKGIAVEADKRIAREHESET